MTGFAKIDGQHKKCSWSWGLKSVNSKGCDIRFRLPSVFDELVPALRDQVIKILKRGNLTITSTVELIRSSGAFRFNQNKLDFVISSSLKIETLLPNLGQTSAMDILASRGVIEDYDQEITDQQKVGTQKNILADFDWAIQVLEQTRVDEGLHLTNVLTAQLGAISNLTNRAKDNATTQHLMIQERLQNQIQNFLGETTKLPDDWIAHEISLLIIKADVSEEIDHLFSHETTALDYLKSDFAVGCNLDFLCQELNREANTLCSKSTDVELTKIENNLKSFIDRFREQIQNIE